MRFIFFLSVLILMVGCRCGSRIVEPLELGLRVEPDQIDFGRVLEGDTKQATLTLYAETRARVEVALSTEAPFGVEAAAIVPGGGQTTAFVSFHAGNVDATGVIVLIVGERRAEVPVKGTGVRPLECRPSATCIVSTYSLEEDRCIETQAEDDSACDTDSVCLEQGRCRMGQCVGIARKCDDQNTCTDDACAMEIGCVHTPHVCPRPMAACHVATCDPTQGCGEGLAPDFLPCGQQDCIEVNLCVSGACRNLPTPEGLPCSPAVACLPEGQCHNQQCTRPKEADWVADWSAPLAGELTGALASSGSNIFFSTCVDAGEPDAGELDAGQSQGCGLSSYTGTGFERFTHWYDDEAARDVVAIQTAGVVMRGMGALELRSKVTGELTQSLAFVPPSTQLVVDKENIFFWADGGIYAWHDGGTDLVSNTLEPSAMGRGDALFAWNADAGLLTRIDVLTDGGTEVHELLTSGFGSALAIAGDVAVFGTNGSAWLNPTGTDAGSIHFEWVDAGSVHFFDELTLTSSEATNLFFQQCTDDGDGGCAEAQTFVRVVSPITGSLQWESMLEDSPFPVTMMASTLVDARPGAFTTLLREDTDAGPRAALGVFIDGVRQAWCHLPVASGSVEVAHFSTSALVITVRRPDGRLALESYALHALPVSSSTWSTAQGVGGTRTDGP